MSRKEPKMECIKATRDGTWGLIKAEDYYLFAKNEKGSINLVRTPNGEPLLTTYESLANRIFDDLDRFGDDCYTAESILPWHFTMVENFSKMAHSEVETVLDTSFLQKPDWTFDIAQDDATWADLFGEENKRKDAIREWLSKSTHMQMSAACCIGNAYFSLNIAFILARLMENFEGRKLHREFIRLAKLIAENSDYGPVNDIVEVFKTFELYYGIPLYEEGPIINEKIEFIDNSEAYIGKKVSIDKLIGRNYYLYVNGKKSDEQPFEIELSDFLFEEDADNEEGTDNELKNYLPEKCWVKRINSAEDGYEAYTLLALSIDNKCQITDITTVLEEVERVGSNYFMIPGVELPGISSYEELDYIPDEVTEELEFLFKGRFLPKKISLIGKKLPNSMIEDVEFSSNRTIALQSSFRLAYMHMAFDIDKNGIIESFDYTTYQSSGNSFNDMFSRPQNLDGRKDEAIDMLLDIIDKYTNKEFQSL